MIHPQRREASASRDETTRFALMCPASRTKIEPMNMSEEQEHEDDLGWTADSEAEALEFRRVRDEARKEARAEKEVDQ
jgi:hypothetical protein